MEVCFGKLITLILISFENVSLRCNENVVSKSENHITEVFEGGTNVMKYRDEWQKFSSWVKAASSENTWSQKVLFKVGKGFVGRCEHCQWVLAFKGHGSLETGNLICYLDFFFLKCQLKKYYTQKSQNILKERKNNNTYVLLNMHESM